MRAAVAIVFLISGCATVTEIVSEPPLMTVISTKSPREGSQCLIRALNAASWPLGTQVPAYQQDLGDEQRVLLGSDLVIGVFSLRPAGSGSRMTVHHNPNPYSAWRGSYIEIQRMAARSCP